MKSITSQFAQAVPDLSLDGFRERYAKEHPQGGGLTPDNIRQAFAEYNRYCRKFSRGKGKTKHAR